MNVSRFSYPYALPLFDNPNPINAWLPFFCSRDTKLVRTTGLLCNMKAEGFLPNWDYMSAIHGFLHIPCRLQDLCLLIPDTSMPLVPFFR